MITIKMIKKCKPMLMEEMIFALYHFWKTMNSVINAILEFIHLWGNEAVMKAGFKGKLTSKFHQGVIRISVSDDYHFFKFNQFLFSGVEVLALDHLNDAKTCFKKVILVPKSYASVFYQCKMPCSAQHKCADSNGKGLMNTQINSSREGVLMACYLSDHCVTLWSQFFSNLCISSTLL